MDSQVDGQSSSFPSGITTDFESGLSSSEVRKRQAMYGPNSLDPSKAKSVWQIFAAQFKSLLTFLLMIAAFLSFLFEDNIEAVAIGVVIILNAAIGFWAEHKATRSMAALRKMGRTTTRVKREGKVRIIPAEELVPGDTVLLDAGDIVTADIQLIESSKLQVDESLLTGESVPVDKKAIADGSQLMPLDHAAQAFKGAAITRGSATGTVIKTGPGTELGKIATLTSEAVASASPLEKRLQKLSEQLLVAVLTLTTLLIFVGILLGHDTLLMVKTGVALAVAAIPEGLPIVATLALARGMLKLASRSALIERLSAVETLGSVNIILTDKTGTLTENKMTATRLVTPDSPDKNGLTETGSGVAARALRVCALCYSGTESTSLTDPMETALVNAARTAGYDSPECEQEYPRVCEESFDPNVRMMATIHRGRDSYLYAVKGATEAILDKVTYIANGPSETVFDQAMHDEWLKTMNTLASRGLRVLALAEKTANSANETPYKDLVFLGLICLEDPPRSDAAFAVKAAQNAGIRVVMATGDNVATGKTIAAAVGITDGSQITRALEGRDLISATDLTVEAQKKLINNDVFARMSPKHKLELISFYQKNGAVVAMTGDGVNDAPALKKADVGIAMGQRGTEVAKEAADMILKDDSFASIILAIQQGRVIFTNIRRFVIYLMSCNISEVLIVTLAILSGLSLPLLPLQILFLNLVTDVFPALALGFGGADKEILNRPPRPTSEGLIEPRHWRTIVAYACLMTIPVLIAYYWALSQAHQNDQYANTVAFMGLALAQLLHVFNMRNRKTTLLNNQIVRNPFVWGAVFLCLGLLGLAAYWAPLSNVLRIAPLDGTGWFVIVLASSAPLVFGQIAKSIAMRRQET